MKLTKLRPELVVLCGRDREALEVNASLLGFRTWSASWRETVQREDVDVVDICTPGASHGEIALAALEAGKHVLCEKPLANNVQDAMAMASAAEKAAVRGQFCMVGFNYRRVPALALAQRLVQEGRIGSVRHVRARYLQDWLVDESFPLTWRLDRKQAGSGALSDLGAHVVDLVRFLTGVEFAEVAGTVKTFVTSRPLAEGALEPSTAAPQARRLGAVTVDDTFIAVGLLEGGALATLEATRMAPGCKNALRVEVDGSAGSIGFDLERLNELQVYEDGPTARGSKRLLVTSPDDPYVRQWWPPGHVLGWEHTFVHEFQDFLAALADGRQPVPSFLDGLQVQIVLDAIERSASEHRWAVPQLPG
jgi:predicted dehydrogenase